MNYQQRLRALARTTGLDGIADELRAIADEMDAQPGGREPVALHGMPVRIAEVVSSSDPGKTVPWLVHGDAEIAKVRSHRDFVRWIDTAPQAPSVPDGWSIAKKGDGRIVVKSPSGDAWAWEDEHSTGTSNDFVYSLLSAMLAALAQPAEGGEPVAWACWPDGQDPKATKPQLCHCEPTAYRQRHALVYATQPASQEQVKWCEYVAGMVDCWVKGDWPRYFHMEEDRRIKAIAGIIERRLWALKREVSQEQTQQPSGGEVARKLIGWRTENFLWETDDPDKARNWEPNIGVLPIFEGDPNTKLTPPAPKQPMTDGAKRALISNFFAEGWAQDQAMNLLHDYDLHHGITSAKETP